MDIRLNFINQSNDRNNSSVVVFAKNTATQVDELAVAWLVIRNCGQGDNHPFVYPTSQAVAASDSYGNYTPQLPAQYGQLFSMRKGPSGDQLGLAGPSSSPSDIEVLNGLPSGAINAYVYKTGRVFATKTSIAPNQKAVFRFQPKIWIGVVSEAEEGMVMNTAIIADINTELSLLGIASADIVMTGGGSGPESMPFEFVLQNIVMT
jgi:hypothetical protein